MAAILQKVMVASMDLISERRQVLHPALVDLGSPKLEEVGIGQEMVVSERMWVQAIAMETMTACILP